MKSKTSFLNLETALYLLFILIALITRFWDLGLRTLSYDESLHAYCSWKLAVGQGYVHTPITHGPFLFHLNALVFFLLGANDLTARIIPALFGAILVGLPYFLRRELGKTGALTVSALCLISPSLLYYSRYIRNDIYIAVWAMLLLIAFFNYLYDRKNQWLYLGATALALALCTKEVSLFYGFIFLSFIMAGMVFRSSKQIILPAIQSIKSRTAAICLLIMSGILIILYSTFFTNMAGLITGTTGAIAHWAGRHAIKHADQPWNYYLFLMSFYEFLPFIFALAGTIYYLARSIKKGPPRLFICFLLYWSVLSWTIYAWAGEKMPWLLLHMLLPTILLAGNFFGEILKNKKWAMIIFLLLSALTLRFSWLASFVNCDNSKEFFAFAQSSSDIRLAMQQIKEVSLYTKQNKTIKIAFDKGSAWPFEWYLRNYPDRVYYRNTPDKRALSAPCIIAGAKNDNKIKGLLKNRYHRLPYRLLSWPIKIYERPFSFQAYWQAFWVRQYNIPPNSWPRVQPFYFYVRKYPGIRLK